MEAPNPDGHCFCGCGQKTALAKQTSKRAGHVAGEHVKYVHGHHWRGRKRSAETVRRMSEGQKKTWRENPRTYGPMPDWWKQKISDGLPKREEHWRWRGGKQVYGHGYVGINVGREHPMANSKGCVAEHRLVMAEHLGRILLATEDVHHINGNKRDNRIENLELVNHDDHSAMQRRKLHSTAINSLLDLGHSEEQVAEMLHMTVETVRRYRT